MIKYGLFFTFIGLIIFEGVRALPTSKKNDTRIVAMNQKHPRNKARRSIYYDNRNVGYKTDSVQSNRDTSLESVVLAIDTGVKNFVANKNKPDIVDSIAKTLVDFVKKSSSDPVYRSKGKEYDIRPELVRFKDEKPSVLLEINSESIINGLKDLLRSKQLNKLMKQISKQAAVVYQSVKRDLDKDNKKRGEQQ